MNKPILTILFSAFLLVSAFSEMRIWTSIKGDTLEAEYMRDASGKVWLKPVAGKAKIIPIAALSDEDQLYIMKRKPPKIEIEVDDDIDRGTVGSDIDNVQENLRFTVEVKKTSKAPYPAEYEVFYFIIAEDIRLEEFYIADKKNEKFTLEGSNNNSFSFSGQKLRFEHDPDPAWGNRYAGYLVCVKMDGDQIVASKGKDKYLKQLNALIKGNLRGTRFDSRFNPL